MSVEVGRPAPDFDLPDQHGQRVRLSDLRGRRAVLLVFYPWAFTGVCGGELRALQQERAEVDTEAVRLLAVSTDSMFALRVFAERESFEFSLLSDFWPHGAVASAYGVLDEQAGVARRGTFLVDTEGIVRWRVVKGIDEARDVEDYKKAVAGL